MSAHFLGVGIRYTAAGMQPSAALARTRLWLAVTAQHVHDYQVTTLPTCFVCMVPGCGVTVRLLPPVRSAR